MVALLGSLLAYIDPGTGFVVYGVADWLLGILAGVALGLWGYAKGCWSYMRARPRLIWCLVGLAIVSGVVWFFMAKGQGKHSAGNRVIVLGFDGYSPKLYRRWAEQGLLPNLRRLEKNGGFSELTTTTPPHSPVAWSSFATGVWPGEHGVFDFIHRDPSSYRPALSTSNFSATGEPQECVAAPRWWQRAAEAGIPSEVLFCPVTFPPGKVKGAVLSGMGVPDVLGTEGTYTYYSSARRSGGESPEGGRCVDLGSGATVLTELRGPRVRSWRGEVSQATVPLRIDRGAGKLHLVWQGHELDVAVGEWSGWQEVSFPLGWGRKMAGIFRFLALEAGPGISLYVSPIQFDPRRPHWPISSPKSFAGKLAASVGFYATLGMPSETWAVNERILSPENLQEQTRLLWDERLAIFRERMAQKNPGILMMYFESVDTTSHMFWRDAFTRGNEAPILHYYQACDQVVGDVVRQLGPDDVLLILSDHGFTSFERAVNLNAILHRLGYLNYLDGATEGAPLLANVDWSTTRVYAVGFNSLYVNVRGREKEGIVAPAEVASLCQAVRRDLLAVRDNPATPLVDGPAGSASRVAESQVGSAASPADGQVGSATPLAGGQVGPATRVAESQVGSATPLADSQVGSATSPADGPAGPAGSATRLADGHAGSASRLAESQVGPISHVYFASELWGHTAFPDRAPDMVVGYREGYRSSWQTAMGGAAASEFVDNTLQWSGDHLVDPVFVPGVVFANRAITRDNPGIVDLAPTILGSAGVKRERIEQWKMAGKPLW